MIFLINDLRVGGAERVLLAYAGHLRRMRPLVTLLEADVELRHEIRAEMEMFVLPHASTSWKLSHQDTTGAETASVPGPLGHRGRLLLEAPGLLWRAYHLARLARTTGCEVVSTFLNRAHVIALLAKLLFEPRLRVIVNVHEVPSRHLEIFFAPPERMLMRAFIRHLFPHADLIVAVSEGVRQDLAGRCGVPADRVAVVHNPIDLRRIRRAAAEPVGTAGLGGEWPLLVGVGRLVHLKGFDLLVRAMARLQQGAHARLLLIGEGEARAGLERLIQEQGLADRVHLLGAQSNPWKYMARADVVVVPSRTDAFPNVIGEALALGRPVVAAACSDGIREYLRDGHCGVLVPAEDVEALAQGIDQVLANAPLRHRFAKQGRAWVETLDLPGAVQRYESLILRTTRASSSCGRSDTIAWRAHGQDRHGL